MRRRQLVASAVTAGIIVAILPLMLAFRLSYAKHSFRIRCSAPRVTDISPLPITGSTSGRAG